MLNWPPTKRMECGSGHMEIYRIAIALTPETRLGFGAFG